MNPLTSSSYTSFTAVSRIREMVIGYRDCGILVLIWFKKKKKKRIQFRGFVTFVIGEFLIDTYIGAILSMWNKIRKLRAYIIEVKIDFEIKERVWQLLL